MSTSLFTAEEKRQVRWFVMRAYKNEKMAEDRLKDKEYGLEYFILRGFQNALGGAHERRFPA